jgi:hypothetical protein
MSCPPNFSIVSRARTEFRTGISIGSWMRAFNCSRSAVQSALATGLNPPQLRDRHLAIDTESNANILAEIKRPAEKMQQEHTWRLRITAAKCASLKSRGDG